MLFDKKNKSKLVQKNKIQTATGWCKSIATKDRKSLKEQTKHSK